VGAEGAEGKGRGTAAGGRGVGCRSEEELLLLPTPAFMASVEEEQELGEAFFCYFLCYFPRLSFVHPLERFYLLGSGLGGGRRAKGILQRATRADSEREPVKLSTAIVHIGRMRV